MPETRTLIGPPDIETRPDLAELSFTSAVLHAGRDYNRDVERLIATSFSVTPEPESQLFSATGFGTTSDLSRGGYYPPGSTLGGINSPWSAGALDMPSGPLAQQIAARAMQAINSPNAHYYKDPNVACAAFVSRVLTDTQAIPTSAATPSAMGLRDTLARHGAVQILAYNTPIGSLQSQGIQHLKPGDILFFHTARGRKGHRPAGVIGHTEVYTGDGMMVGTSSRITTGDPVRRVRHKSLVSYPSYWFVTAYRLPPQGIKGR